MSKLKKEIKLKEIFYIKIIINIKKIWRNSYYLKKLFAEIQT